MKGEITVTEEVEESIEETNKIVSSLPLIKNNKNTLVFSGSKIYGYNDKKSDLDCIVVTNGRDINFKYYVGLQNGSIVDINVFSNDIIKKEIFENGYERPTKDKLIFTPPIISLDNHNLNDIIEKGLERTIDKFFNFLCSITGKIDNKYAVLFDLKTLATWPQICQFIINPSHRYRIARKISSPKHESIQKIQAERYRPALEKKLHEKSILQVDDNRFEYVGERSKGESTLYKQIISDIIRYEINFCLRNGKKVCKKVFTASKNENCIREIPIVKKIERKLLKEFEQIHAFYLMWQGFSKFKETDRGMLYKGLTLERISTGSYTYGLLRSYYRNIRNLNFDVLKKNVKESEGILEFNHLKT